MKLDKVEENPLTFRKEPALECIMKGEFAGYNRLTGKYYYKKIYPELKFLTSENHQSIMYYWDKMGSPSRMHRWCCAVMKTAPLYRLLKEEAGLGKQPSVLVFEGVRAEESERRSQYNRTGKGVKHNN